jgi:hypothetical protein
MNDCADSMGQSHSRMEFGTSAKAEAVGKDARDAEAPPRLESADAESLEQLYRDYVGRLRWCLHVPLVRDGRHGERVTDAVLVAAVWAAKWATAAAASPHLALEAMQAANASYANFYVPDEGKLWERLLADSTEQWSRGGGEGWCARRHAACEEGVRACVARTAALRDAADARVSSPRRASPALTSSRGASPRSERSGSADSQCVRVRVGSA